MFKSFSLDHAHPYDGIFIRDTEFCETLPIDFLVFSKYDYHYVYSAYVFDLYKKKKMNAGRNYIRFIRALYSAQPGHFDALYKSHILVLSQLFPDYYLQSKDCLFREATL